MEDTLILPDVNKVSPDSLDVVQMSRILTSMADRITTLEATVAGLTSTKQPPPVAAPPPPPPDQP